MFFLNYTLLLFSLFIQTNFKPNPVPKQKHKFIIVCHRGDHTVYPENTLEGYKMAIKDAADYIEIDLRATKDGKLVSMHDGTVNRMTDGKGNVKDLTFDEIKALKVKANKKDDTLIYRVPSFEEILKLCRNRIHIYIDFKEADAKQTLKMLRQFKMENQVLIYINKPSQIGDWRETYSAMPLMYSLPANVKDTIAMRKFIDQYQPDILDGDYTDYDAGMVKYAQNLGLTVWPDAQSANESPQVWDKVIALGFKGVQTDHPLAAIKYFKEKGLR